MAKTARKHFEVNEWGVSEINFSEAFSEVAESVFSLGNEFMGCRGFLEEDTKARSLRGSYYNGIYEYALDKFNTGYKGVVTQTHYMVNGANLFDVRILLNGKALDMADGEYCDYCRTLDFKTGKLTRTIVWKQGHLRLKTEFCRFLDMQQHNRAYQQITFSANSSCEVQLCANIHFEGEHFGAPSRWQSVFVNDVALECATQSSGQHLACAMDTNLDGQPCQNIVCDEKRLSHRFCFSLQKGQTRVFTKLVSVCADRQGKSVVQQAIQQLAQQKTEGFEAASVRNEKYWSDFWRHSDIEICGDREEQQGIRFCIFQLQQTYHGADPRDNVGAKGLTGEAYSGHAFWDTETYCLPYYLFNNPTAAKYLLEYRYSTLEQAKQRARELDCSGACYPIATLNGNEACTLWQHASLQMQPSTGVAYGIYHYCNVCHDDAFLFSHGVEMLVEICRYLVTRGQWSGDGKNFGYYAVMGPDEFQMMVNHNTYTNYMAQKTLRFTVDVLKRMPSELLPQLKAKTGLGESEAEYWTKCADSMLILYDEQTKLFEQHDGYFKLPHINIDDIPDSQFPLYSHWSYDRIYRNDMIKQPDVLMFQLLYNSDFSFECKLANYNFYEPRCIHESSLSPSVHSILANELGKYDEAVNFFAFATRMDLDDYNRNTREGLHTTSIAAAWLNIVYGFGGLRSDKELSLSPTLPQKWQGYCFSITVDGAHLTVRVDKNGVEISGEDHPVDIVVYGKKYKIQGTVKIQK